MEKRKLTITILVIVFILFLGWFFFWKTNCKNEACFDQSLAKCSPARYYGYRNNNLYYYSISRSFGDCRLHIRVDRMAIGSEPDLVRLLGGKSMDCTIPKEARIRLDNMENLLDYCHGELKESLLQLMIERLYGLVVRDMKSVVQKAQQALRV